ncbi:MAG: RidA family protein [Candidatus Krumholzibacteria bacterium]|nr:RidA family protein [Candidatus Krumholzibacteria bacterium]
MKKPVHTNAAPAAIGPYSQAIRAGDFLFISGQLGLDPATKKIVEGGVLFEAERALMNIGAILEAAGGTFAHVVKTTVLLQSMDDFSRLNEVYARFFSGEFPARAAYQVARLPLGALVEIEAIAYLGA